MADSTKIKRDWLQHPGNSILSPNIPLPNIVRVEPLNAQARARYLGNSQELANNFQGKFEKLDKRVFDKFYGFSKGNVSKAFALHSEWAPASYANTWVGLAESTLFGGDVAGSNTLFDTVRNATNISLTSTGAATMKRFKSTSLAGFSFSCGWYLPEQFVLCFKSLKAIISMAYPYTADVNVSDLLNKARAGSSINQSNNPESDALLGPKAKADSTFTDPLKRNFVPAPLDTTAQAESTKTAQAGIKSNATKASDATASSSNSSILKLLTNGDITKLGEIVGRNTTFDPVPVRCSIGHYMDIEPLVIKDLKIEFSDTTFINSDGRHLPLFCTVSLDLDFWMTPSPDLQFMSLLGYDMFSQKAGN